MTRTSRVFSMLIAAALVASACSGSSSDDTTTSSTSGETTAAASTTTATTRSPDTSEATTAPTTSAEDTSTTIDPALISPINGLLAESAELLDRRVVAVKIDNHQRARPQSGLQEADAVIELLVEGGFSRFIALFHDNESAYVGPVRSMRPTDSTLVAAFDGTLVVSGGQSWVRALAVDRGVPFFIETSYSLFRIGSRFAPHNLYGDTELMRQHSDELGFGDEFGNPLYEVAEWETIPGAPATEITIDWAGGHVVTWRYEEGEYRRWEGSSEHRWVDIDGNSEQISADVLVILVGTSYTAFGGGKSLPATETTGSGQAHIFHDGRILSGTWARASNDDSFTLTATDGTEMTVPPGYPWISVFPSNRRLNWS